MASASRYKKYLDRQAKEDDETNNNENKNNIHIGVSWFTPMFKNSCTIDPFLTSLILAFRNQKNFSSNFKHTQGEGKRKENGLRVIELLSNDEKIDSNLVKAAFTSVVNWQAKPSGVFDYLGSEEESVFMQLTQMSEFLIRFICNCPTDSNDSSFVRVVNRMKLPFWNDLLHLDSRPPKSAKDPNKILKRCQVCQSKYFSNLHIPDTTWMMVIDMRQADINDTDQLPFQMNHLSKTFPHVGEPVLSRWQLAYVTGEI